MDIAGGVTIDGDEATIDVVATDTLDRASINALAIAPTSTSLSPLLLWGTGTAVHGLVPSAEFSEGVQYRIRENTVTVSSTNNPLLNGTTTTFTLTNDIDNPVGKYIWIYNRTIGGVTSDTYAFFQRFSTDC